MILVCVCVCVIVCSQPKPFSRGTTFMRSDATVIDDQICETRELGMLEASAKYSQVIIFF